MYNPEAFVIFPIKDDDNYQSLGNLSRSVNYVYTTLSLQHKSILLDLKAWIPFPEDPQKSDNLGLMDYTGYTSAKITYFLDEQMFTLKGSGNFATRKGAVEATYSYPLIHNYFFIKENCEPSFFLYLLFLK